MPLPFARPALLTRVVRDGAGQNGTPALRGPSRDRAGIAAVEGLAQIFFRSGLVPGSIRDMQWFSLIE